MLLLSFVVVVVVSGIFVNVLVISSEVINVEVVVVEVVVVVVGGGGGGVVKVSLSPSFSNYFSPTCIFDLSLHRVQAQSQVASLFESIVIPI